MIAARKDAVRGALSLTVAFGFGGQQTEEDPGDWGTQGKINHLKKDVQEKERKKFSGSDAYRLFLEIYQLILWKQCHALVNKRGFPPELEDLVRDLWALRLETYAEKIAERTDGQPKFFSSQAGSAAEDTGPETFKLGGKVVQWPRLIDTVALCYLASVLMRLPVSVMDFHRMTLRNDIPFYNVFLHLPRQMKENLPEEFISILQTTRLLEPEQLHNAVLDLLLFYHRRFGVQFPPLNTPVLSYRLIKRLALPVDIYPVTKRLQELLAFTFEWRTESDSYRRKRKALEKPEHQLVTLIVIATKLLFPFDDVQRHPMSTQEPTVQTIDWEAWADVQNHFDRRDSSAGRIGKGKEILVKEGDVFTMTPDQLDEYMDWYESSWLDTNNRPTGTATDHLVNLFPIGSASKGKESVPEPEDDEEESIKAMLQNASRYLRTREVVSEADSDIPRPGSQYARYRHESDLPDTARAFYEVAAKVVGISVSTLVRCVSQAELQINKWLENQRRIKHFAERSIDVGEDSDVDEMEGLSE
ncbi:uncharacterized protein DSM5745_00841 [Aspergillus mulundensis]|uniref:Uncharacterized protein n=1 Tax=Aspergillus mulundensis TaxID=1810919 RepID=A0A3D8T4R1_9EURO|nr:hypothetical protein DSM5745_00841 [Aspergillus mulundensis]RDW93519.1 hypothetical protein DSM5745_00841 [Aspergillus mulundensis]